MMKFSFNRKQDLLIPETNTFKPFIDKNGIPISGDRLIHTMANVADKWEKQNHMPVPIAEQKFITWLKETSKALKEGASSEDVFKQTIVPIH